MKIGIISDSHGYFDDKAKKFLDEVDEIWHAGDIGPICDEIASFKPLKAVYGNIDSAETRLECPKVLKFYCEQKRILITHITGYPKRYDKYTESEIIKYRPQVVIGGHSHILKVIYDKKYDLLYINPGAIGNYGFHNLRTAVKIDINASIISNLEIAEWKR